VVPVDFGNASGAADAFKRLNNMVLKNYEKILSSLVICRIYSNGLMSGEWKQTAMMNRV